MSMKKIKELLYSTVIGLLVAISLMVFFTFVFVVAWTAIIFLCVQSLPVVFAVYFPFIIAESVACSLLFTIAAGLILALEANGINQIPNYLLFKCIDNNANKFSIFRKIPIYCLLKLGADINAYNRLCWGGFYRDESFLYEAIQSKNLEKIRFLIRNGADIHDIKFSELFGPLNRKSSLMLALRKGDAEIIQALAVTKASLANLPILYKIRLLHNAILCANTDIPGLLTLSKEEFFQLSESEQSKVLNLAIKTRSLVVVERVISQEILEQLPRPERARLLEEALLNPSPKEQTANFFIKKGIMFTPDKKALFLDKLNKEHGLISKRAFKKTYEELIAPVLEEQRKAITHSFIPENSGVHMPTVLIGLIADYVDDDLEMPLSCYEQAISSPRL